MELTSLSFFLLPTSLLFAGAIVLNSRGVISKTLLEAGSFQTMVSRWFLFSEMYQILQTLCMVEQAIEELGSSVDVLTTMVNYPRYPFMLKHLIAVTLLKVLKVNLTAPLT